MPPAKFAEVHRQRADEAARPTKTTNEIKKTCNPGLTLFEKHGKRGQDPTPTAATPKD
jgi:hypothetical protein